MHYARSSDLDLMNLRRLLGPPPPRAAGPRPARPRDVRLNGRGAAAAVRLHPARRVRLQELSDLPRPRRQHGTPHFLHGECGVSVGAPCRPSRLSLIRQSQVGGAFAFLMGNWDACAKDCFFIAYNTLLI